MLESARDFRTPCMLDSGAKTSVVMERSEIGGVRVVRLGSVDSTQDELRRILAKSSTQDSGANNPALCIIAKSQTKGRGSRGNAWSDEGGLMFSLSYAAPLRLPDDLPPQSMAIFLGYIIKQILAESGSQVWLKYPNDLYISTEQRVQHMQAGARKVGGILVEKWRGVWLCGVGINLCSERFGALDIALDVQEFLSALFLRLQNPPSWKQIFSNYKLEFCRNYPFAFHAGDEKISLQNAQLLEDGSVRVGDRVIYNLRDREV